MIAACPTCGRLLAELPRPGTSRVDNETLVCASCSELEGWLDLFGAEHWRQAVRVHWRVRLAVAAALARAWEETPI